MHCGDFRYRGDLGSVEENGGRNGASPHFVANYLRVVFGLLYLSVMEGI